ncbi:MAG: hypothetical protein WCD70_15550 [Alphaproteobacteria bacterium]
MSWFKIIFAELVGIFVDDGLFAATLVVWLGVTRLLIVYGPLPESAMPIVFFAGLACILVESAARRARKGARR